MANTRPLPDWPIVMDAPTARQFLTCSLAEFRAWQAAGLIPPPRTVTPGVEKWHREELEEATRRIFALKQDRSLEEETRQAHDALRARRAAISRAHG